MSEEIALAIGDIAELRRALRVAMDENERRIAVERRLLTERDQALAKVEGLSLAADQYSESRDQWMLKAKAAETQVNAWMAIGARGSGVVDAVRAYQQAVTNLDGISAAEQALWNALALYDQATKARAE